MIKFLYYYLRSMRLYYSFITGCTVLFGIAVIKDLYGYAWNGRDFCLLAVGFLAWGVNQIFADWLDRKEDALNAPRRPMVSGSLKPGPALCLSAFLMLAFAVLACRISPWALLVLCGGGVLNLLYSACKKIPVLNTLIYGCAITLCFPFGAFGTQGKLPEFKVLAAMPVLFLLILPAHMMMCHNSYFKDTAGDRASGIRTLPVLFPRFSLWLSGICSVLYSCFLSGICMLLSWSHPVDVEKFAAAWILLVFLLILSGLNIWNLVRKKYHAATRSNCQLCTAFLLGFMVCLEPYWLIAEFAACILIHLLFLWYPDEKE